MRRLEQDLNRFTIELEADTAGITEILEQSKVSCCTVFCVCFLCCWLSNVEKAFVNFFSTLCVHVNRVHTYEMVTHCV